MSSCTALWCLLLCQTAFAFRKVSEGGSLESKQAHSVVPSFESWGFPAGRYTIENKDLRAWLSNKTHWLQGEISKHPRYEEFPFRGVFAFKGYGPAAIFDATHFTRWKPDEGTFELDLDWLTCFTGSAPYLGKETTGREMLKKLRLMKAWYEFHCPVGEMADGELCDLKLSIFGTGYVNLTAALGRTQTIKKASSGRMWKRETFCGEGETCYNYDILRLVDENHAVDEENLDEFIKQLNGTDVIGWSDHYEDQGDECWQFAGGAVNSEWLRWQPCMCPHGQTITGTDPACQALKGSSYFGRDLPKQACHCA